MYSFSYAMKREMNIRNDVKHQVQVQSQQQNLKLKQNQYCRYSSSFKYNDCNSTSTCTVSLHQRFLRKRFLWISIVTLCFSLPQVVSFLPKQNFPSKDLFVQKIISSKSSPFSSKFQSNTITSPILVPSPRSQTGCMMAVSHNNNDNNNNDNEDKDKDVAVVDIDVDDDVENESISTYQPLVDKLMAQASAMLKEQRQENTISELGKSSPMILQYWVGIAGGPGSGKTTVAETIADLFNTQQHKQLEQQVPGQVQVIVLGMDGFHIPQKELISKYGIDAMKRRGAPFSFDAILMKQSIEQIKEQIIEKSSGENDDTNEAQTETNRRRRSRTIDISWPIYSREISDPVPNTLTIQYQQQKTNSDDMYDPTVVIFLVEGLYVLMQSKDDEDKTWKELSDLWDDRWYVECPSREIQIERLVERSSKTWSTSKAKVWGEGLAGVRKRVMTNDVTNMDFILQGGSREVASEIIVTI